MSGEADRLRATLREIAILAGEDYDAAMAADDPAALAVAAVTMLRDDFVATLEGAGNSRPLDGNLAVPGLWEQMMTRGEQ